MISTLRPLFALVTALPLLASAQNQQPLYSTYSFNPLEHLAGITPYFEPQDPPRDPAPPRGCHVTKAAYLVRHAAINANDFDYESYLEPLTQKLANASLDWSKIPNLSFLAKWSPPDLGEQEQLTRTGKLEAAQLGVQLSYRYHNLRLPKRVWASSAERTVASAKGLIRGLEMEPDQIELVQIYEGKQAAADSLTPHQSCPRYSSSFGSKQSSTYVKQYTAPILGRLHSLAPSFNWTMDDVVGMFEWCGYETVIRGSSPFCSLDLFNPDEWLQFEYAQDIMYHYNVGYATKVSGVMGFPYLNATINLLLDPPENDDQDLYVSFAHRELPPAVLVAMGLFNNSASTGANDPNATMPLDRVNYHRSWQSSYILPFLSNIAIERMNCSASYGFEGNSDSTYYRIVVNQSPQTIPDCTDGPGESCSASSMRQYMAQRATLFGDFTRQCGVENDNSTNVLSIYSNNLNGTTVGKRFVVGQM